MKNWLKSQKLALKLTLATATLGDFHLPIRVHLDLTYHANLVMLLTETYHSLFPIISLLPKTPMLNHMFNKRAQTPTN